MCFSATASFVAAAALGVVGTATVAKAKTTKELPLAMMPLVFALQQFIEGLLWLSIHGTREYLMPLTVVFLFFAFFWWPIYAPLVAFIAETDKTRRKIIAGFCFAGALVGTYIFGSYLISPAPAEIMVRCVAYPIGGPAIILFTYLYVLVTVGAGIVSSRLIIKIFCLLLGTAALLSWIFYTTTFTSVWCFFAALISAVIYFYKDEKRFKKLRTYIK